MLVGACTIRRRFRSAKGTADASSPVGVPASTSAAAIGPGGSTGMAGGSAAAPRRPDGGVSPPAWGVGGAAGAGLTEARSSCRGRRGWRSSPPHTRSRARSGASQRSPGVAAAGVRSGMSGPRSAEASAGGGASTTSAKITGGAAAAGLVAADGASLGAAPRPCPKVEPRLNDHHRAQGRNCAGRKADQHAGRQHAPRLRRRQTALRDQRWELLWAGGPDVIGGTAVSGVTDPLEERVLEVWCGARGGRGTSWRCSAVEGAATFPFAALRAASAATRCARACASRRSSADGSIKGCDCCGVPLVFTYPRLRGRALDYHWQLLYPPATGRRTHSICRME